MAKKTSFTFHRNKVVVFSGEEGPSAKTGLRNSKRVGCAKKRFELVGGRNRENKVVSKAFLRVEGFFPGIEGFFPGIRGFFPGVEGFFPGIEGFFPGVEGFFLGIRGFFPGVEGFFLGVESFFLGIEGFFLGIEGFFLGIEGFFQESKVSSYGVERPVNPSLFFIPKGELFSHLLKNLRFSN